MFAFTTLFSIAATTITLVQSSPTIYPDVIPGPGFPTIEALNLTSKDLYTMKPPFNSSLNARSANFDAECFTFTTADISNTIACYNYLASIPNNACTVPGDNVVFCTAGDAAIGGSNLHQTAGAASSPCVDVSYAVQWIFTNCVDGNGRVGGADAAFGNGDLVVGVYNVDWV